MSPELLVFLILKDGTRLCRVIDSGNVLARAQLTGRGQNVAFATVLDPYQVSAHVIRDASGPRYAEIPWPTAAEVERLNPLLAEARTRRGQDFRALIGFDEVQTKLDLALAPERYTITDAIEADEPPFDPDETPVFDGAYLFHS